MKSIPIDIPLQDGVSWVHSMSRNRRSFGAEYLQSRDCMKSKSFVMITCFLVTGQKKHCDSYTALSAMLGVDVVCASTGRPGREKAVRVQILLTGSQLSRGSMMNVRLPETRWWGQNDARRYSLKCTTNADECSKCWKTVRFRRGGSGLIFGQALGCLTHGPCGTSSDACLVELLAKRPTVRQLKFVFISNE